MWVLQSASLCKGMSVTHEIIIQSLKSYKSDYVSGIYLCLCMSQCACIDVQDDKLITVLFTLIIKGQQCTHVVELTTAYVCSRDWDSSVSIVTGYGLDGPGFDSWWGARFFAHFQTGPGAHPASCTLGTGSFLGVKRPGRGADHPPPSGAEVKKV
jgi:hypothetical protein